MRTESNLNKSIEINTKNIKANENVKEFRSRIIEETNKKQSKLSKNEIDKIFRDIDEKLNGKPDLSLVNKCVSCSEYIQDKTVDEVMKECKITHEYFK